jgi:hypothetical protein
MRVASSNPVRRFIQVLVAVTALLVIGLSLLLASSLGKEQRPVVDGTVQIAGRSTRARFSVTDRSERPNPVLLGRAELADLKVQVGRRLLTTPGARARAVN